MTNLTRDVMFRSDNTDGYTAEELDALNTELAARLEGIEPGTSEYFQAAKTFTDEVARR